MPPLKEKIGQMIMVGLNGEELNREEERLLRDYPLGGFILFSRNLREPKQILSLCRSLWEINKHAPPFIAVDQEGGRVHRLPKPFTHFPSAALVGQSRNSDLAHKVGAATARELAAVGINLNFAPVLDVNSNPDNPIIGDRSFSSDPNEVINLGESLIQGLRSGGIIPCGKHFPGHGDTEQDSHQVLPIVKTDAAGLKAVELPPFVHECRSQVESLMTAHVLYPCLDPDFPATLSRRIIRGLLREELGYEGVVFGDDMEMKAISKNYLLKDAVALSIRAGIDVLMFSQQTESAVQAFEILSRLTEKDDQIENSVEQSSNRIRRLKERYLKHFTGVREKDLKNFIGLQSHQAIVNEIQGSL